MPCLDCHYFTRPKPGQRRDPHLGWCEHDGRAVHGGYLCSFWVLRSVSHGEVGLTPAEVAWARANPNDLDIQTLNAMYRRIELRPRDESLRVQFTNRLERWRKMRARIGVVLPRA